MINVQIPLTLKGNKQVHLSKASLYSFEYLFDTQQIFPTIIVCPGGGYHTLSPRNKEAIVLEFMNRGYQVIILEYSILKDPLSGPLFPLPLQDLMEVIYWIKNNHSLYSIDIDSIILMGFSAGGHLVSLFTGLYTQDLLSDLTESKLTPIKLKAQVLAYPVIDFNIDWPYDPIRIKAITTNTLLHNTAILVSRNTLPTFIWHTVNDQRVSINHTLQYIQALTQNNVRYESHLYEVGEHGLSLGTKNSRKKTESSINVQVSTWMGLFDAWFQNL